VETNQTAVMPVLNCLEECHPPTIVHVCLDLGPSTMIGFKHRSRVKAWAKPKQRVLWPVVCTWTLTCGLLIMPSYPEPLCSRRCRTNTTFAYFLW